MLQIFNLIILFWEEGCMFLFLFLYRHMKVLVTQLCPTLCNPMDCNPPVSSVCGIFQAGILELLFPSPEDLPDPGIEPESPALQADSLLCEPPGAPHWMKGLPSS